MKASVHRINRPSLQVVPDPDGEETSTRLLVNVPPKLINAYQLAELQLTQAENEILSHLDATDQASKVRSFITIKSYTGAR